MIINVDYKTYDNKLYVVTKPMHEILNKPAFVPNIDVDEVLGILHIRYAYGSDWIWKKDDEYHIGYELEPRYWNKDYDHILVREIEKSNLETTRYYPFYKELINILKKQD